MNTTSAGSTRLKLRCINWSAHLEPMVPEGLSSAPLNSIVSLVSQGGFNCVRLTYSVDLALHLDRVASSAFVSAAKATGTNESALQGLWTSVEEKNPWVKGKTVGRVLEETLDELARKGISVILDNHVSRAGWCCNYLDGNGWFGSTSQTTFKASGSKATDPSDYRSLNSRHFDPLDWLKSLDVMARLSLSHPNVIGLSLRNELRVLGDQNSGGKEWYHRVSAGVKTIHQVNPDALIAVGGTRSASDLSFLSRRPLDRKALGVEDKIVWEFHAYSWSYYLLSSICPVFNGLLSYFVGHVLKASAAITGPLWLSEFGVDLSSPGGLSSKDAGYLRCLVKFIEDNDLDWAYWTLQGSYYVREAKINVDETFGALKKDWSGWRNPQFKELLGGI